MNRVKIWLVTMFICSIPLFTHADEAYLGDKACFACHKEMKQSYLDRAHGKVLSGTPRNDLEALGCEACHGAGKPHSDAMDKDEKGPKMIEAFRKHEGAASEKNKICLKCHEKGNRMHWQGEAHDRAGLSCADCHKIHDLNRTVTAEVCYSCHPKQRAEFQRTSHMPVREGKITCSNCHNPHGGKGPSLIKEASVNDLCYTCHAEKRGPLLWEHAPVRENCLNCHNPHGANQPNLLKARPPFLCQQCHSATGGPPGHPANAYSRTQIASREPYILGKACLNCHTQIHGSNHPSGAKLQR